MPDQQSHQQNLENAAGCLEALGSPTRLEIYRLLVRAGPGGAPVGELQERMSIPASTLSHHISKLMRVGLVTQQRQSRTLLCRANFERFNGLLAYLGENCCQGLDDSSSENNKFPIGDGNSPMGEQGAT